MRDLFLLIIEKNKGTEIYKGFGMGNNREIEFYDVRKGYVSRKIRQIVKNNIKSWLEK